MKILKLNGIRGAVFHVVADQVAAYWRENQEFADAHKLPSIPTVVELAGKPGDQDIWVTDSPEEITRMLLSDYALEQGRELPKLPDGSGVALPDRKEVAHG